MTTIPVPPTPLLADRVAHASLDDDGSPPRPFDPTDPVEWRATAKAALATARAALEAYPLLSIGVALGVGFLVGRLMASRSS